LPAFTVVVCLPRGYNIGTRLIDEYLAKARLGRCANFREAAELVGRSALPMFLNVVGNVTNWNAEGTECSLVRARRWVVGERMGESAGNGRMGVVAGMGVRQGL
jgi:hypothetical protein